MLTVRFGPMFSGKTTILVHDLEHYADLKKTVIGINNDNDNRSNVNKIDINKNDNLDLKPIKNEVVSTHAGRGVYTGGKVCWVKVKTLLDVDVTNYQYIGVDEAHWFNDLVAATQKWLKLNKDIFVSGLDADCLQRPFGDVLKIIPFASKAIKLNAKCHICLHDTGNIVDAPFTKKKGKVDADNITDPGSTDKYQAVCFKHLYD